MLRLVTVWMDLRGCVHELKGYINQDGQTFFVALFRSWCYNAVATFSLCLLAQAYEQAYNLLQIFAELEMTVSILIQIDKLVQLLESPVFTCEFCSRGRRLVGFRAGSNSADLSGRNARQSPAQISAFSCWSQRGIRISTSASTDS